MSNVISFWFTLNNVRGAVSVASLAAVVFAASVACGQSTTGDQRPAATAASGLQGFCPVCIVEMKKWLKGSADIQATYDGKTYSFPGARQRDMFLANPARYVTEPARRSQAKPTTSREQLVTVTGKSGCAACDHGVSPLGAPDTLGLAVNAADGRVYVVEDAHRLYPKVYEGRFGGVLLTVTGKILKSDGRVTWIKPNDLKVLN